MKQRVRHRPEYQAVGMCARWFNSFDAFLADMGPRPSDAHSIDRIDGTRAYEPGNCRWATVKEQQRNRKSNLRVTIDGVTATVADWAEKSPVKANTIYARLRRGWAPKDAIFKPLERP